MIYGSRPLNHLSGPERWDRTGVSVPGSYCGQFYNDYNFIPIFFNVERTPGELALFLREPRDALPELQDPVKGILNEWSQTQESSFSYC